MIYATGFGHPPTAPVSSWGAGWSLGSKEDFHKDAGSCAHLCISVDTRFRRATVAHDDPVRPYRVNSELRIYDLRLFNRELFGPGFVSTITGNCSASLFSIDSRFVAGTTLCQAVMPVTGLYSAMKKPSWFNTATGLSGFSRCKR